MLQAFREGGAGMIPVLVFGALALVLAIRYLARPSSPRWVLLVGATALALCAGGIGTVTGVSSVGRYAAKEGDGSLAVTFVQGLAESMRPVQLSLILVTLTVLVATIGRYRASLQQAATAAVASQ